MSLKLMTLIGNYTADVRNAKTMAEIQDLKETFYTSVSSLFSLQGVVCSLPSRENTRLFIDEYTKIEMPEFNEDDKICFRAGVLNMHTWISENRIK